MFFVHHSFPLLQGVVLETSKTPKTPKSAVAASPSLPADPPQEVSRYSLFTLETLPSMQNLTVWLMYVGTRRGGSSHQQPSEEGR